MIPASAGRGQTRKSGFKRTPRYSQYEETLTAENVFKITKFLYLRKTISKGSGVILTKGCHLGNAPGPAFAEGGKRIQAFQVMLPVSLIRIHRLLGA